jgi:6-phosphogluconate dehydrogenase
MDMGMIGLGRMGANMAQRLARSGHRIVGYDPKAEARKAVEDNGAESAPTLEAMVGKLGSPRAVWMMVPAGDITHATVGALITLLSPGDTIVDGGNSNYKDTLEHARLCAAKDIHYVDCGTSGGVWGLAEGYSLMVGGDDSVVERLRPILETLAPAKDHGWGRVGPVGSGHFTKMVHNGIEYGLMQAYAEGFSILEHKKDFALDLHQIAEIWRTGSVVRSWLLDLTADALGNNPTMAGVAPYVADSGEGRWTVNEAIDLDVPAPVITASLIERLRSRDTESFSAKLLAAMRNEFGGHAIKKE